MTNEEFRQSKLCDLTRHMDSLVEHISSTQRAVSSLLAGKRVTIHHTKVGCLPNGIPEDIRGSLSGVVDRVTVHIGTSGWELGVYIDGHRAPVAWFRDSWIEIIGEGT